MAQPTPQPPVDLQARLLSLQNNPPPHENSRYDTISNLLQIFFNTRDGWIIEPQEFIPRYAFQKQEAASGTSTSSHDRQVQPTGDRPEPDFIVCRYGQDGQDDSIKIVIKVKEADEEDQVEIGAFQLTKFTKHITRATAGVDQAHRPGIVRGLLICGATVYLSQLEVLHGITTMVHWRYQGRRRMSLVEQTFWDMLHHCSSRAL